MLGKLETVQRWAFFIVLCFNLSIQAEYDSVEDFDEWAVEAEPHTGMTETVKDIAKKHGLEFIRTVSEKHMPAFFHLRTPLDSTDVGYITAALQNEPNIKWAEYQIPHDTETKNDFRDLLNMHSKNSYYDSPECRCHQVKSDSDKSISNFVFDAMNTKHVDANISTMFNDYRWPCQWQLYNCGQTGGPTDYDLDILAVWKKDIKGKGMVVAIVDDGVDIHHPEIYPNYDVNASFDFVEYPDKDGPLPYSDKTHGTLCAGIVGMEANNGYCGVGVVYEANVGALRMIGHKSTDIREAGSLIYNADYIDVYSNSWGPSDTGKLFREPAKLTRMSLAKGSQNGRHGRGNIYPFASGNGGFSNDHCGADGFSCNIYTIAIAASTFNGRYTAFSEQCTCIMVTIPSTGKRHFMAKEEIMVAPDMYEGCVNSFSGTSSVTPLASSVFLMALQANPNLTWRDVQHLLAETALVVDPTNKNWQINGAGYGFGAINALRMVNAAETWSNVQPQQKCGIKYPISYRPIPSNGKLVLRARTGACTDMRNQVLKLEHVQAIVSYDVKCRGDISVTLRSPCGTISKLMNTRLLDNRKLLIEWPYMSVFHWGEDPRGEWVLEIQDHKGTVHNCKRSKRESFAGHIWQYKLILWGTAEPVRRNQTAPVCDRLERMAKYVHQSKTGIKPYKTFLTSIKGKKFNAHNMILNEFVEDFSEEVEKHESDTLKPARPVPKKTKPFATLFQRHVMKVWRKTFKDTTTKSFVLADYMVNSQEPKTKSFSSRDFKIVRHEVAKRLRSAMATTNDDGELRIRRDLEDLANALTAKDTVNSIRTPSKKLVHDTAAVLHNLRHLWN